MFGLMVFGAMGIYLLLSIIIVSAAIRLARRHNWSVARWGFGSALIMYMIPFWDLVPTFAAQQYQCANNSGFFINKTVNQWKLENPGVMETLSITHLPEAHRVSLDKMNISNNERNRQYQMPDGTNLLANFNFDNKLTSVTYKKPNGESGNQINERFRYTSSHQGSGLIKLARYETVVFDSLTDEIMARQINFRLSSKSSVFKFWFQSNDTCYKSHPERFPTGGIGIYIDSLLIDCKPNREETKTEDGVQVSCQQSHSLH